MTQKKQTEEHVAPTLKDLQSKFPTKSAMIRHLDAEGYSRGDIAKILGIRYQHVRNVLITPVKTPKA